MHPLLLTYRYWNSVPDSTSSCFPSFSILFVSSSKTLFKLSLRFDFLNSASKFSMKSPLSWFLNIGSCSLHSHTTFSPCKSYILYFELNPYLTKSYLTSSYVDESWWFLHLLHEHKIVCLSRRFIHTKAKMDYWSGNWRVVQSLSIGYNLFNFYLLQHDGKNIIDEDT